MSALLSFVMMVTAATVQPAADDLQRQADIDALTHAKEVQWNGYYRNRDAAGLERFLADGFVHLNADGTREGKEEAVTYVRENDWPGAANGFVYTVTEIAFYSDDVANVYGNGQFDGSEGEAPCRMQYTSSNVFVRQSDGWHPIFSHSSKAFCLEPEKK